jgi:hypothetical protein
MGPLSLIRSSNLDHGKSSMSRFIKSINEQEANNGRQLNVFQSYNELQFDVNASLKDGKTTGYVFTLRMAS